MNPAVFAARHARALLFSAAACLLTGALVATQLPVALFPTVSFPRVQIMVEAGDRPAERMMVEVTQPLEEAVGAVPGVASVRSITSRGSCEISVNVGWGLDMNDTLALLQGAIAQVRGTLPAGSDVHARRMDPSVFPVIAYSLRGETTDAVALRDLALYRLRPLLVQVAGVAQVAVLGGEIREFAVDVDPVRLLAHGLTLAEVRDAVANTNEVAAVGRLDQDRRLYLVVASGQYPDLAAIGRTVVKAVNGLPVTVADVATVGPSTEPQWIRVTADGKPAVLVNVYQQRDASTVSIARESARRLEAYRTRLPRDVTLAKWYDQSDLIVSSMHSVRDSILVGVALGVLVLFAFLRHGRVTAIAAASVPVSIGATLLVLGAFGEGLNIMTLGGIAAAVGLILDDAIVVIENVMRHAEAGGDPGTLVAGSVGEMTRPVIASSLCSIVVHAPLAFLTGVTGAFFASLSLTVVAALAASLLFSLFVVPPLASRLLMGSAIAHTRPPGRLDAAYRHGLTSLLRHPLLAVAGLVLTLFLAWGVYRQLETGFLPEMDEGAFVLDYFTAPGSSLEATTATLAHVEQILLATPEVETYSLRTGAQLGEGITEPNQGDFLVKLRADRSRDIATVIDEIRHMVATSVPGITVEFLQLMEDLVGDLTAVPQPIEIKIFGDDRGRIETTARHVAAALERVPGVVDVFDGIRVAGPTMHVEPDPTRAGRFGLTTHDVADALGSGLEGRVDADVVRGEKRVRIRVRTAGAAHAQSNDVLATRIPLPAGGSVPLDAVADLRVEPGSTEIARENLRQMVAVTGRIEGHDLGGTVARVRRVLTDQVRIPADQDVAYGGLYREQQASFRGLLLVLLAAIGLVFLVLLFAFESFSIPTAILAIAATSLLGVLGLLWLTNTPLNVSSLMGMVMVVGIVAENGVFLLFYAETFHAAGEDLSAALLRAGLLRARPIVMTTLAAVLALLPLAVGLGAGAQMQKPLAIAVIGGFSLSVPLLLFGLPPLYRLVRRA